MLQTKTNTASVSPVEAGQCDGWINKGKLIPCFCRPYSKTSQTLQLLLSVDENVQVHELFSHNLMRNDVGINQSYVKS